MMTNPSLQSNSSSQALSVACLRNICLLDILRGLWSDYEVCELNHVKSQISETISNSAFQPLSIETEENYQRFVKAFNLENIHVSFEQNNKVPANANSNNTNKSNVSTTNSSNINNNGNTNSHINNSSSNNNNINNNGNNNRALDDFEDVLFSKQSSLVINNSDKKDITNLDITNLKSNFIGQKTFPFSELVPKIIRFIYLSLSRFFIFAIKNPHLGSRGESLCSNLSLILEHVCSALRESLGFSGADTPLSKACQISIDSLTLASSCDQIYIILDQMLKFFHWNESIDTHLPVVIQQIKGKLIQVSLQAQDMIFELLSIKIDDLLSSLVFINFIPEKLPLKNEVHDTIDQIIGFLNITFMWLTHLPQSAREAAHFTCCSKVANSLLEYILSPSKVHVINTFGIAALDLKKLENFADNCGIIQLRNCFSELSELINIILSPELPILIENPTRRKTSFPKIDSTKFS